MVKRIALGIGIFLIIVVIFILLVLQSPALSQPILKFFIQKNLKGYDLQELAIGRQRWIYPGEIQMSDVTVRVSSREKDTQWSIKAVKILAGDVHRIFLPESEIPVEMHGVEISGPVDIGLADLKGAVDFTNRSVKAWRADVEAKSLQVQKYQMTHVSARLAGQKEKIDVSDMRADFYEGQLKAQLHLQLADPVGYQSRVRLTGVNLSLFKGINDVIYQNIYGIADADAAFEGRGNHLQTLDLAVNMTEDAQVRASLLKFVVPYIPPTQDIKALQELIRQDLKIPVEKADLNLQSADRQKLSGAIHLGVKKINVDLNLPIDILFDGSLVSLVQWYQKYFQ